MMGRENLPCSCVCSRCHGERFSVPPNQRPDRFRERTGDGLSTANCRFTRTLFSKMTTQRRIQGLNMHILVLLAVLSFIGPTPTQAIDRQKRQSLPGPDTDCWRNDDISDTVIDLTVRESAIPGTVIGVLPITGTTGSSGTITLTVVQDNDRVSVNVLTKQIILIQSVDADVDNVNEKFITLQIRCQTTSSSLSPTWIVNIIVDDVNDNTPFFIGAPYTVNVPEGMYNNEVIFNGIEGDDNDGNTVNGQIEFDVLFYPADPLSVLYFDIPNTGKGEVTFDGTLDFEEKQQWVVLIEVRMKDLAAVSFYGVTL
ncbi:cadherin-99C-like [Lytechinus variegatus]|uniref:cadherin-99C-like n=1 Tax=Lytechinus variegatus TaxID=7654 RepID=UPI001BB25AC5|nr:cadherin-99C-like [Lytechinus variegatus]